MTRAITTTDEELGLRGLVPLSMYPRPEDRASACAEEPGVKIS